MIRIIGKIIASLWSLFLFCETNDPIAPDLIPDNPCVLPCTVIDGIGTALITIGMQKRYREKDTVVFN